MVSLDAISKHGVIQEQGLNWGFSRGEGSDEGVVK